MIPRVLLGVLVAALVAIVVLAILYSRALDREAALIIEREVRQAVIDQASANADATIRALDAERDRRATLQTEFDHLNALLDSAQLPSHAHRPPSRTIRERRESILRAVRQ